MLETDEGPRKEEQEVRVQERTGRAQDEEEERQATKGKKENTERDGGESNGVQMVSLLSSPLLSSG